MDSQLVIIVIRILHVTFGMFWVGSAVSTSFLTLPTVRATGPVGGQFFGEFLRRNNYPRLMLVSALVTIATGIALYWDFYAGLTWSLRSPGPETIFGLGGLIAIAVALIANIANPAMARRLGAIAGEIQAQGRDGGTPPAELIAERNRLSLRLGRIGIATASLLVVSVGLMAAGRYV